MNDKNKRLQTLQEKYPALLGKFLGFKYKRGGMGVTRTDSDWFECDEYYITADDLAAFLEGMQADLAKAEQARSDMAATLTAAQEAGTAAVEARRKAEAERDAAIADNARLREAMHILCPLHLTLIPMSECADCELAPKCLEMRERMIAFSSALAQGEPTLQDRTKAAGEAGVLDAMRVIDKTKKGGK